MIDEAMSPLRRRMIEDMTIRMLSVIAEDPARLHPNDQELGGFPLGHPARLGLGSYGTARDGASVKAKVEK